ncbi:ComEA family DNA-binding protein [Alicyclobacillus suci]|uniref:ComEA family DNA-binding protein n=1 Tax=Alicyclobacillus suci TaxID=2816080 RepID=UPI001A8CDCA1|nr:ComEA family DNA-binding protein [Alicyclobacillus suci]
MGRSSNLWLVDADDAETLSKVKRRTFGKGYWPFPAWLKVVLSMVLAVGFVTAGCFIGAGQSTAGTGSGAPSSTMRLGTSAKTFANSSASSPVPTGLSDSQVSEGFIQVDVHGDVARPGVVKIPPNSRVKDAIQAAGGFLHAADKMSVNAAALLWDGEELDVPVATRTALRSAGGPASAAPATADPAMGGNDHPDVASSEDVTGASSSSSSSQRIDLNTADATTLESLPGVGPKRASAIVSYRSAHGLFQSVDDLLNVKGIGSKTLAEWAPNLYVDAQTGTGQ